MGNYLRKWAVPSDSRKNKRYIVSLTSNGTYECSCQGWIFRHKECKHIERVIDSPWIYEEIEIEITGIIVDIADKLKA